ncbi:MAG: cation:proton antiporter [Dehalococcoidia bacterium]|nr:cation:proton antiporter [Dehalococcoidia bacterium]
MEDISSILVDLFIIFASAKVASELFERLRQPPVIGELLVGILIGPYALGLIGSPSASLVQRWVMCVASDGRSSTRKPWTG